MLLETIGGLAACVICGRETFGMYCPAMLALGPAAPKDDMAAPGIEAGGIDTGGAAMEPGIWGMEPRGALVIGAYMEDIGTEAGGMEPPGNAFGAMEPIAADCGIVVWGTSYAGAIFCTLPKALGGAL
mmetsp:Transcript_62333/g.160718  ORF Transcript_62333/g.160718 Transcript_62333/m.160718 type:complete len:128 (-) Transcript_62333:145-528(-)